MILKI